MLIEELIRLGRPLVNGGLRADETLNIVTDVADPRARNFFRNVFIAELPKDDKGEPQVWRLQLGDDVAHAKKTDFVVSAARAVGLPFTLPSGGNPLHPQGCYALPVYPCYDPHLRGFRESADRARDFLVGRLERTTGFALQPEMLETLCQRLHEAARRELLGDAKRLGVLVLVRCAPGDFHAYASHLSRQALDASRLVPGHWIEPNLERIVEAVWAARLEEGAAMGERPEGVCSVSGVSGRVVSAYCKAWPWALPTWTCPVAHAGDTKTLIDGLALSADTYRALTMGACVFSRLTKPLRHFILHEVFAPTANQPGRELAQRRSATDLDMIYGAVLVLPLEDRLLEGDAGRTFGRRTGQLIRLLRLEGVTATDRHLEAVTGFESIVPEELDTQDYRLTLVYFSGDPSRGVIYLRACIQEVLPSIAARLTQVAAEGAKQAVDLLEIVRISEKRREYLFRCYCSVPYLLTRGYGGTHVWERLERILHQRTLSLDRVTANSAARLASLVPRLPDSRFDLAEEAVFWLCWRDFVRKCNAGLATASEEEGMPMRAWRVLLHAVEYGPIEELHYDNPAELGFGCGALIRRFSWKYSRVTGHADYLKQRVLNFGADLSPDVVWKVGLRQMFEVAKRYDELRKWFENFFQDRVGATLHAYDQLRSQVSKNRDEFMTAFWAGYSLQGYNVRNKKPNTNPEPTEKSVEGSKA